jgi:hypothetical protein
MSPPPSAPYFPPDQALSWLNMGVIGNPNSLPGRYYFDSTILVNRSTYDIEVVDMSLGPPDEGEQSGVAYYWYESALHPLIASGPVPDPFPDYLRSFDGTPMVLHPVDAAWWQIQQPQGDPSALTIIVAVDYRGGERLVLGPLTVTYRLPNTSTTYSIVVQSNCGVICPPGDTGPCIP